MNLRFVLCLLLFIPLIGCVGTSKNTSPNGQLINAGELQSYDHDDASDSETLNLSMPQTSLNEHLDPQNDAPVIAFEADECFNSVVAEYNDPFIASSLVATNVTRGDTVIAFNSPKDDALFLAFDGARVNVIQAAQNAQVSCLEPWKDGVRVALIVRDAAAGSFSHEVKAFDANLALVPDQTWRVSVRGFQSDAGTRCAFLGNREILVTGIRPRGDNPPYHGLFNAQSRSLNFFENTQDHTPVFVSLHKNHHGANEILLREVIRDENNKPLWPYSVYRLENDNLSMSRVLTGDFVVPTSSDWLVVSKTGCCEYVGKKSCLDGDETLTEVTYLGTSDGIWMLWTASNKSWIVQLTDNGDLRTATVAANRRVHALNDQFWAVYELDSQTPDLGKNLKIIRPNRGCFII